MPGGRRDCTVRGRGSTGLISIQAFENNCDFTKALHLGSLEEGKVGRENNLQGVPGR